MRALVGVWRALRLLAHIAHGVFLVQVRWSGFGPARRQQLVGWWSAKLLRVLGVRLEAPGAQTPAPRLITANHVSWLDIAAIHAVMPEARFVSKADIAAWPVVGSLATAVGTLYIERASKRDALRVVHKTAEALAGGETVAVFPEGTTGAGYPLLPLHGNLLQAAISTHTPLQPVVLRWYQPAQAYSEAAQYIGQMTLIESLWRILTAKDLAVEVRSLPAMSTEGLDRRHLAEALAETMSNALPRP